MAGFPRLLAVALVIGAAGVEPSLAAQEAQPTSPATPATRKAEQQRKVDNSPEMQNVRKALEALSPEQRKRFAENMLRWSNLTPDEKKALRDRDEMRKKLVEQETAAAIREMDVTLDGERREQFVKRYAEERKKIEEQLRKEMADKRKPLLRALIQQLKTEFAAPAPAP